ncbi:DUF1338 family protein [Halomonas denitrificans]|uniref:DUF1338 family protein n=1 Tax=Halomonas denitrificans TaxID=370769 RepID=UPI001CD40C6C|nr:DUF1338 family protein [Halomonas denitrificans]MCA0973721.1 DUF1338 family protein [Halomonas denitrificans]
MTEQQRLVQQLRLDYIHQHPDVSALRLWPVDAPIENFTLVTLSQSPWNLASLLPMLEAHDYRPLHRYALPERGLLACLLGGVGDGPRIIIVELQTTRLSRAPRDALLSLVKQGHPSALPLPGACRPWPMPDWSLYERLHAAHPLAAWLSVMGPRVHHVALDCQHLGRPLSQLDNAVRQQGLALGDDDDLPLPMSAMVEHRFYPTCSRRLAFAHGDEHRVQLGGLLLLEKQASAGQERTADVMLPPHSRCEIL